MQKLYKPARMAVIFIILASLLTVYVSSLYKIQIYDTRPAAEDSYPQRRITRTETLAAARGDIYDRNGVLLVSSRPAYNISLSRAALRAAPDMNGIILSLVYAAVENGIKYTDAFPMTLGAPFDYLSGMRSDQRAILEQYLAHFDHEPDIPATELFNWMKNRYNIDYRTGILDARLIIGVQYELETRAEGINTSQYVFARDVGADFVALVKEMGYPGVIIESSSEREYHTEYAAHLLGYIGSIDPEDMDKYMELNYPRDALVGRMGAELAFEEYLHGTPGKRTVVTGEDGTVLDVSNVKEPVPGSNVYLTVDIRLQAAVEDALKAHIDEINIKRAESGIENEVPVSGGAVVVTDVNTGELLASASYPTFNLETFWQDYTTLATDNRRPMYNRAELGTYNPGSTYKMVTAFAGLRAGSIGRWTTIFDGGRFTKYSDVGFQPSCWSLAQQGHGHGALDVVGALENSCNVFFYQLGDSIGATAMANAADEFGLGEKTGLHILESKGTVATPEYKKTVLNDGWWAADTVMSAIGQSHNRFTPVQLANYVATIANNGTRYAVSELSKVKSPDFTKLIYEHIPTVMHQIEDEGYLQILREGMRAVAKTGTASSMFSDYQQRIAAKTGTVQTESQRDNGVFVCYAPYDNPEIAISVVVERGGSGLEITGIARSVLDFYFEDEQTVPVLPDGELIP